MADKNEKGDQKSPDSNKQAAGKMKLGGIDTIIVNHLQLHQFLSVWMGSEKDFLALDELLEVNMKAYIHTVSHALPYLKKSGNGHVGVVASINAKLPFALQAMYSGARFAMDGFFSSLRLELQQSQSGVTVTLGVIGGINTETCQKTLKEFEKLNISVVTDYRSWVQASLVPPQHAAYQIMVATETGQEELYCPATLMDYIPLYFKWGVIIRSIFPSFTILPVGLDTYLGYENMVNNDNKL